MHADSTRRDRRYALLGVVNAFVLVAALAAVPNVDAEQDEPAPPAAVEPEDPAEPSPRPEPEPEPVARTALSAGARARAGAGAGARTPGTGSRRAVGPVVRVRVGDRSGPAALAASRHPAHRRVRAARPRRGGALAFRLQRQGADVIITPARVHTREISTTDAGCPPEHHEQDAWTADFFRADPHWTRDGSRLMLVASRTVIAFEET